jgi:hypothetical protein
MASTWLIIATCLAGYAALCHFLRYRARDEKAAHYRYQSRDALKRMTNQHAWEIQQWLFQLEFPFTTEKALEFALFRTYAIPTISKLLMQTNQLSSTENAGKVFSALISIHAFRLLFCSVMWIR